MKKDIIKSLIEIKQSEIPFPVIAREVELPLDRNKIITIPGVRRCGKSTLMMIAINELFKKGVPKEHILWLGFDDERLKNMTSDELNDVIESYMEMFPDVPIRDVYMFFDEIQLIKDWEYFIIRVYKSYCKNIYVSGSNATMLSTELKSVLRGWPLEYETYPLSFLEYCEFKGIDTTSYLEQDKAKVKNACTEYIKGSAFPEVVLTKSKSEQLKLLQGYFNTMILRDMVEHYGISNTGVLRYFVKRILGNLSKPTSILAIYNDIKSQGLKVSKDDLYHWADCACAIFLLVRIPKYERSLIREQRSPYKFYCIDNGLRSAVLLPQSEDNGKLLENTVLLHLKRHLQASERIFYYQGKGECDFALQSYDRISELIQVTWDMSDDSTRNREINGIIDAAENTLCEKLTIITNNEEGEINVKGHLIRIVPIWKWLQTYKGVAIE